MQITSTPSTESIVIDDLRTTTTSTTVAGMDINQMTQLPSNYHYDISMQSPSRREISKRRGYYHPYIFLYFSKFYVCVCVCQLCFVV